MADRPNILLFLPDAMQAQVTFPESDCLTPNMDRVAARGVRFRRVHAALPTCSPSRASLMTGRLPHNHGVLQVEHCADDDQCQLRPELPHWAQRLSTAGYRTGYFGKWHIERTHRLEDFGWQVNGSDEVASYRALGAGAARVEELLQEDSRAIYHEGPEGYRRILHCGVTGVEPQERRFGLTTTAALDFVKAGAAADDQPWACCVSFSEPNTPLIAGAAAFGQYDVDRIQLPASLEDDHAANPGLYRRQREIFAHFSAADWRETRGTYYALVTELDQQLGRLLDALEETGQLENTIVLVASDHGRYLGAHGFDAHNFGAFEEAYNVPLIAAGPGIAPAPDSSALVSLMDLGPTLLELVGAEALEAADSRSFAAALADPARAADFASCYAEFYGTRFWLTQRVLWRGNWKFVFNGFDQDELYDLAADPHELRNLGQDPAHAGLRRELMGEIWRLARRTGDTVLLQTHYAPMRFGAVGPDPGAG